MSLELNEDLRGFLRALSFANFELVPNFFEIGNYHNEAFNEPPLQFEKEGKYVGFLLNAGGLMIVWVAVLMFMLFAWGLYSIVPKSQ
jgi:hypothetical protein